MLTVQNRVTKGDDYRVITRTAQRSNGQLCLVYVRRTGPEHHTRYGFIISRAVGGAVVRNRIRRRLKAICAEHLRAAESGFDIVIRVHPAAAEASFTQLHEEVFAQVSKLSTQRSTHG